MRPLVLVGTDYCERCNTLRPSEGGLKLGEDRVGSYFICGRCLSDPRDDELMSKPETLLTVLASAMLGYVVAFF